MVVEVHVETRAGTELVGRLYPHRRGRVESATFAYDDSWIASPEAYALEPQLELRSGSFQTVTGRALFGCFADSAPDRWGQLLIKRAERRRAVRDRRAERSMGEIDLLLGVRDDLRQGALRFRPSDSSEFVASEPTGVPHLHDLRELLAAAGRAERDRADDADYYLLLRAGSSLGGARPKAHVVGPEGQIAIAKFPSAVADEWDVMAWEKVALDLAALAEINVPRSALHRVGSRRVLVVDRFDRNAGNTQRIGYISAMTMLEARDGDTHSYLEIAEAIEQVSPVATRDMRELWSRVAFSILISNTDDHLRNHGFLRIRGGWSLSPIFDVNPNPDPGPKHLSTAIDFDSTAASIDTLMEVAASFRVTSEIARETIGRVSRAVGRWREIAQRVGIAASEIGLMESAFDADQRRVAERIAARA
jgi:serine/threonine-protein kinase HipA